MFKKYKLNRAISRMVEDKLYEMALDEVEKGILKKGAWARALSQSDGVDAKAKSIYLQYRVEAMKDEAQVMKAVLDKLNEEGKHEKIDRNASDKDIKSSSFAIKTNKQVHDSAILEKGNNKYIDIETVSEQTVYTKAQIINLIREGEIAGLYKKEKWYVHSESVITLKNYHYRHNKIKTKEKSADEKLASNIGCAFVFIFIIIVAIIVVNINAI